MPGIVIAQSAYDIPKILPPSPTAAAFARYGEIPVDISSGLPSIQIPLHTITSRKLSVPLALSYHASGVKVDDVATPVGLGWVLQGMGIVTRTVIDRPDDGEPKTISTDIRARYKTFESYYNASINSPTHAQKAALSAEVQNDMLNMDKQSDRFTYQLPGKGGGAFRYDIVTGNCVLLPYKPVQVSRVTDAGNYNRVTAFGIVDEAGTKYIFDKAIETAQDNYRYNKSNTSFYLTSIVSADGTDTISYQYSTSISNEYTSTSFFQTARSGPAMPIATCRGLEPQPGENTTTVQFFYSREPLLEKITSATTIVTFGYSANRRDIRGQPYNRKALYRLAVIKVLDRWSNQIIKEIILDNNDYFEGFFPNYDLGGGYHISEEIDRSIRLKLNGVQFRSATGLDGEKYTIDYEPGLLPPYNTYEYIAQRRPVYAQDFWGYYNGQTVNTGFIPAEFAYAGLTVNYGGNRRPNHNEAKACLIRSIRFSTGGKTEFEFEPNDNGSVGGFRIKTITDHYEPATSPPTTRTYTYDAFKKMEVIRDKFICRQYYYYIWTFVSCGAGNGQKTIYHNYADYTLQSSPLTPLGLSTGAPIVYTRVTEYNGVVNGNTGKAEYYYTAPDDLEPVGEPRYYGSYAYDFGSFEAKLLNKKVYRNDNGVYKLVKETNNTYKDYRGNEFIMGVNVTKESSEYINSMPAEEAFYTDAGIFIDYPGYLNHIKYNECKATEKVSLLTKTEEKDYNDDGTVNTTVTIADYRNLDHLLPTEKVTFSSAGDTLRTTFEYAPDNTTDAFAASLRQAHVFTALIEQKDHKNNNVFINSVKTNYAAVAGVAIPLPATVTGKAGNNAAETRLTFNQYDPKGNILDVSKGQNGVKETYLYGYNGTLPVAKIIGSNYATAITYVNQNILNNPANDDALRAHLNNLRNISGALVTTFTYKPLVGITSETSPNGKTTFYEYDALNRLKLVRDNEGRILKTMEYHLKAN